MAPAALISSTPGCPMISLKSMAGTRDGGGIDPNFATANCDILCVPVLASIGRCSGRVVVKNGCANRNGGDLRGRALGCFDLLAMQNPPKKSYNQYVLSQPVRLSKRGASAQPGFRQQTNIRAT